MPLQWLPLQQRQRQITQPRSAVSQALTPGVRRTTTTGAMPTGVGFMERMREQEALEAERKYQEKMMKMQHEQEMEKMKFAAGMQEDAAKKITPMTAGQALGREPATQVAPELTKENMPEAAMEVWKFISTLEPESQKFFIQQLKQKEQPTGYIEAPGKRIEVPGSVGMYGHLVDQGLIDPATDTVIEKKPEEMKGRFAVNTKTGEIYNTTTGEVVAGAGDVPTEWDVVYTEVLADGLAYIGKMMDASWMQTMDTDEMYKYIQTKKAEYRSYVASQLFAKGMTGKEEINRLADLAVGSYDWEKHLDEAKARGEAPEPTVTEPPAPPPETNRGLPLDEEVVAGLKELFKDSPEELDNIEQYKNEYGEINVNKALGKEKTIPTPTTIPSPLKTPTKVKTWEEYKGKRRR